MDYIRQLLQSIEALDRTGLTLEIVIADGMSTDGTRDILNEYACKHSTIRVLENKNRTASHGLNLAIQQAKGEFVVRMDAHTEYPPKYVVRCLRIAIATGAENVGGAARTAAKSFWKRAVAAGFHSKFATGGANFRSQDYSGFTDTVPYGCWRKDLLYKLGLFDETLVRNQDDELNLRIRRAGGTVWQDSSIVSYYHPRSTLRALFRQYFQYGFWRVAVLRKHRMVASKRQLVPIGAIAAGALLVLCLLLGWLLRNSFAMKRSALLLGLLTSIYASLSASSSIKAARRHGWDLFPVLPIVFGTYQFSYAAGFAAGLLCWRRLPSRTLPMPRLFTNPSR